MSPMDEVRITQSRTKVVLLLAGSLAFVAAYALLPDPDHTLPVWGGWFFGLCALVAAVLFLRPRALTLDEEGFSISGGLIRTPRKTAWKDVTGFFPISPAAGSSIVGFNYSADAASKPRGTWVAKHLSGADAGISGGWSCSTVDLARQLNAYRDRALAQR